MAAELYSSNCDTCSKGIFLPRGVGHGICNDCLAEQKNSKPTLKLFTANIEPDDFVNMKGFYVMVLAVDLESAKAHIQKEFNDEYYGTIDVYLDDVTFTEIVGPFPAGKVLVSLHY